jgi:hypothetical protein
MPLVVLSVEEAVAIQTSLLNLWSTVSCWGRTQRRLAAPRTVVSLPMN